MKYKFTITYVVWIVSLILYIYICSIASETQEQFFLLLSWGLMVFMIIFCTILMLYSEKTD